jgi:hypothetical protein
MTKIIDLGQTVPQTIEERFEKIKLLFLGRDPVGIANYRRIFGSRWVDSTGLSLDEIERKREELGEKEFTALLRRIAENLTVGPEVFIKELEDAGIEWALVNSDKIEKIAELVSQWPDRLKGIASVDPFKGDEAVRELERAIRDLGLIAYYASPFDWGIKATDDHFFPLYEKASELAIPVFIYTSMNYRTDLPMDIARPLYLDQIAMSFPNLKIVADCGGWPWVPEMIGVARRHPNVFISTTSNRPKYLATPGSGWEMLMQFGNTLLQDQVVFSSGASDLGLPISTIVDEMLSLPLKDKVKEKWLYKNATRLFGLG